MRAQVAEDMLTEIDRGGEQAVRDYAAKLDRLDWRYRRDR